MKDFKKHLPELVMCTEPLETGYSRQMVIVKPIVLPGSSGGGNNFDWSCTPPSQFAEEAIRTN